jgi:hypothetical protein
MRYQAAFLTAMTLPASAAAHSGPHSGMSLLESVAHLLGPGHVIGLALAVGAAALLALRGTRSRPTTRGTRRDQHPGEDGER